ncbi:MAG: 4Fe-4S binding protein [Actinomycetota bacterium]
MCVGCGRCLELCPVGVDIHRSVHAAVESGKAGEESK